jgi:glycosyltransferase involved in cell wall biosynthesis
MKIPKVSIILPVYNGAQWIAKSIGSALGQTFNDFELIVLNDCSSDDSEKIILDLLKSDSRIIYKKNISNFGLARTLNSGIDFAKGEYIARLDQDDEWIDKDKLKKQINFLDNNPDYVLIGTGAVIVDEKDTEIARYILPTNDIDIRKKILRLNCFVHASVVFRKVSVEKVGRYRTNKFSEDHDLWLRLGRIGKFANLPEYSVKYLFQAKGLNSQTKIFRLRQNMLFAKEHRDFYPNYIRAVFVGWVKIIFLPIFSILPQKLKGFFLKIHKKL